MKSIRVYLYTLRRVNTLTKIFYRRRIKEYLDISN